MSVRMNWKTLWVPLILAIATVGVLWVTNRAVAPREATWNDVIEEAKSGGYQLTSTNELKERIRKKP